MEVFAPYFCLHVIIIFIDLNFSFIFTYLELAVRNIRYMKHLHGTMEQFPSRTAIRSNFVA